MIITFANETGRSEKSVLANHLAGLRIRAGRKVLVLDNDPQQPSLSWSRENQSAGILPSVPVRVISGKGLQPELENLILRYQDIVIDTEARDSLGSRSALNAASIAVISWDQHPFDMLAEEKLVERLCIAKTCNPNLRILIVIVANDASQRDQQFIAAQELAMKLPQAEIFTAPISTNRQPEDNEVLIGDAQKTKDIESNICALYYKIFGETLYGNL